jgi:hypothetical protein
MTNGTTLTTWSEDGCPEHGGSIRKAYRFGQYEDATVYTFWDCHCAVCVNEASLRCGVALGHEYTYHQTYGDAAGRARLIATGEAMANAPFEGD